MEELNQVEELKQADMTYSDVQGVVMALASKLMKETLKNIFEDSNKLWKFQEIQEAMLEFYNNDITKEEAEELINKELN